MQNKNQNSQSGRFNAYQNCRLCPRACGVNRYEKTGFCGAGTQMQISRIAPHFGEEPVISGVAGSGTVFFCHCSLGCVYCQNFKISGRAAQGLEFTPQQLCQSLLRLQQAGVHNINLVTATHYAPGVAKALELAKANGLHLPVIYNCGGFESLESLQPLNGLVDVYLPDLKYFSPSLSKTLSATEDYFDAATEAINEMVRRQPNTEFNNEGLLCKGVLIRHLVLPGQVQNAKQVLRAIYKRWGNSVPVSLMRQYTPAVPNLPQPLDRTVTQAEYEEVLAEFNALGLWGFAQQEQSAGEGEIPVWNRYL